MSISQEYLDLMIAATELLDGQEPGSATSNLVRAALEQQADYMRFLALTAQQKWPFASEPNVISFQEWSRLYAGAIAMLPDNPASAKMTTTILGNYIKIPPP